MKTNTYQALSQLKIKNQEKTFQGLQYSSVVQNKKLLKIHRNCTHKMRQEVKTHAGTKDFFTNTLFA